MFLTMFKKTENIVLTMHISDVFGKKYFKQIEICNKLWESAFFNNLLTNTRMVTILYYISMNIVNPNHFWHFGSRQKACLFSSD